MKHLVSLLAAAAIVCGCAGYSVQEGGTGKGYDVYRPEPYLLGEAVGDPAKGTVTGYKFAVIWLPNYSKRYRVHSWAGFGKANFTFTYSEGWKLTQVTDQSSNENVLSELTGLVKHLLPADPFKIAAAPPGGGDEAAKKPPGLLFYKIDIDECSGNVCLREVGLGDPTCLRSKTGAPTFVAPAPPSGGAPR